MFSLIKLAIDAAVLAAVFYGGVKFGIAYPTVGAKLTSLFSWVKSLL
jgi:hypothetical protein